MLDNYDDRAEHRSIKIFFDNEVFLFHFLAPSVRREAKGLSELLLLCFLRHFSDILIFWKIFKSKKGPNNDLLILVMSVFEP